MKNPFARSDLPDRPYVRKKLIILPDFQYALIGINCAIILALSALIWIGMMNALKDLQPATGLSGYEIEYYKHYIEYQVRNFQLSLALSLIGGGVISIVTTVILSHRLAGPIYRLTMYFKNLSEGAEQGPLTFREKDYLQELPGYINQVLGKHTPSSASTDTDPSKPLADSSG